MRLSRNCYKLALLFSTLILATSGLNAQGSPDCQDAVVVCTSGTLSFNPQGQGAVDDFADPDNSQGCLSSGELNTAWYYFEFNNQTAPGEFITFVISPNGSADYDFAVYGPNAPCGSLGSPIRCSYAAGNGDTGLSTAAADFTEGAGGDGFVSEIPVDAGQGFYLVIDNFSGNNTSFELTWGGTAADNLNCNPCGLDVISFTPSYDLCPGGAGATFDIIMDGTTSSTLYEWTSPDGGLPYLNNPFILNPTVTIPPGVSGTFTYNLTAVDGACSENLTITVNASAVPPLTINGPSALCTNQPGQLSVNPGNLSSYSWSNGASGSTVTVNGPGTYSVTATNSAGCTATTSFTIAPLPPPTVNITGGPNICPGGSINLSATPGFAGYDWNTGQFTPSITVVSPGLYTVTVTDATGCQGETSIQIVPAPEPVPSISGPAMICPGQSAILEVVGGPFQSYLWSNGSTNPAVSINSSGTYTVQVTNAEGCTGLASFTVGQGVNPVPVIMGNTIICAGESTQLGLMENYQSYNWSTGSTAPSITVDQTGEYFVTVTNSDGCEGVTSVVVTEGGVTEPVIDGPATLCPGVSGTLSTSPGYVAYDWSTGSTSETTDIPGPGAYSLTVTGAGGCTTVSIFTVDQASEPNPVIEGESAICEGGSTILALSENYDSYQWSDGSSASTLSVSEAGTYSVTVANSDGCTGESSTTVDILPPPAVEISGPAEFCPGSSVTLEATAGYSAYAWSDGSQDASLETNAAGTYTVTVTDDNGCQNENSFQLQEAPVPSPMISGNLQFCESGSTELSVSGNYSSISWSDGQSGSSITVSQPGPISVTVINDSGCEGQSEATVESLPLPSPQIQGLTEICPGGSTTLQVDDVYVSYDWNTGSVSSSTTVSSPGAVQVTVVDANGCTGTALTDVVQLQIAPPVIEGPVEACEGQDFVLTANPGYSSYNWSTGGSGLQTPANGPGDYSVSVTTAEGCESNSTLTVAPLPSPELQDDTQFFCAGEEGQLTAPDGFVEYQWSGGDSTQVLVTSESGAYSLTVTNSTGCSAEAVYTLEENPLPDASISGAAEFCEGASATLQGPDDMDAYSWSTGATTQSITVDGPQDIFLTVTDAAGCQNTDSVTTQLLPLPEAIISGIPQFCEGGSTTLSAGPGPGYSWSTGSTDQSITVNAPGQYLLTVTDANGCTDTSSVMVSEVGELSPVISGPDAFCSGETITLQGESGYTGYQWSTGDTGSSITISEGGTYSLSVEDANGCTGTTQLLITENLLPELNISGASAFCEGSSTTLSGTAGYDAYLWSDSTAQSGITVSETGTYSLTVTDANGCTATESISTVVHPLPVPEIAGLLEFCPEDTTTLSLPQAYESYSWSTGAQEERIMTNEAGQYAVTVTDANGCTAADTVVASLFASPLPAIEGQLQFCADASTTLQADTAYAAYLWSTGANTFSTDVDEPGTVSLSVTDANGCAATTSVTLTENALPAPEITGQDYFCSGESSTLSATPGFPAYAWSSGDTTAVLQTATPGQYAVTVTDANGCTGSDNFSLQEAPLPAPAINGTPAFCPGESTTLFANQNFAAYSWSTGDTTGSIVADAAGTVVLTVTDELGCVGEASATLSIYETENPAISGPSAFCPGETITLQGSAGFASYLWSNSRIQDSITVSSAGMYALTVTDENGCVTADSTEVISYTVDPPVISGPQSFCSGSTASLQADGSYTGYLWSTGAETESITVDTGGIFRVSVTDANGCESSANYQIIQNPLPEVAIGGSTAFCPGGATELNAGSTYAAYLWSDGSTSQSIVVDQEGTYSLTVTDENGCVNEANVSVTEEAELSPVISGPLLFCPGGATTLSAGAGFTDYSWSDGSSSQTLTVSEPGTYSLTVADAFGCSGSASVQVGNYPEASVSIDAPPGFCAGSEAVLVASGPNISIYAWENGSFEAELQVDEGGTYTVVATDVNGCRDTAAASLQVFALPQFSISGQGYFCAGASTELMGPEDFASYSWNTGATQNSITVSTAGTYALEVTDENGCRSEEAIAVANIPLPQADAGPDPVIDCNIESVALGGPGTSTGSNLQYSWSGPGITPQNESLAEPSVTEPGLYELLVTDTEFGCISEPSTTEVLSDENLPEVVLSEADTLDCVTASVLIDGSASDQGQNLEYSWYNGAGSLIASGTLQLTVENAGTYILEIVNTANGCQQSATASVAEDYEQPIADAGPAARLDCEELVVPLDGSASSSGGIFSYEWLAAGGTLISTQAVAETSTPGQYTLLVTNTQNGCRSEDVVEITQDITAPQVAVNEDQQIDCLNPNATLDGTGSSDGPLFRQEWAYQHPDSIVGQGLTYNATQPGTYFLVVTNEDNRCESITSVEVTAINEAPSALLALSDGPTCFGDTDGSIIVEGVEGGTPPYLYSFNGAPYTDETIYQGLGAGSYTLSVQDMIGCEYVIELLLEDGNDLSVELGDDIELGLNQPVQLAAVPSIPEGELVDISWQAADSLSCEDCLRPAVLPTASGLYIITIVDENGCVASDELRIFLNKERRVFAPNAFSPNGDNTNEVFFLQSGPEVINIRQFEVFNRWGEPVFFVQNAPTNDPDYGWDGTYRGELMNGAVFVWYAEVVFSDGRVELFKGDVVLMR